MDSTKRPSGSLISFMSNKVKKHGGINFAQGIPGFDPPEELLDILRHTIQKPLHQYAPGIGNHQLLNLLLQKYREDYPFKLENFLILQGATEALSLLFIYFKKNLNENFSCLSFEPVYESYKNLPGIFNTPFIPFSYDQDGNIDFKRLEKEITQQNVKLIFMASPGNPFGKIWSKDEFETLLNIIEKNDIYLILDSVYRELYFQSPPYIPLDQFNKNIFYVNSFSKIFSITGWRIGYLIAHEEHMEKIQAIHDYTGLCAPSILQAAIAEYLEKHNMGKSYTVKLRQALKQNYQKMANPLKELNFSIPEIHGGYFIWASLPKGMNDGFLFTMDLYEKQKVAVIPGEHFSDKNKNYIRINIARKEEEIDAGIKKIRNYFQSISS